MMCVCVPIEMAMIFPLWFFFVAAASWQNYKVSNRRLFKWFYQLNFDFIGLFALFFFLLLHSLAYCECGAFAQTIVKMTEMHIKNVRSVSFYMQTNEWKLLHFNYFSLQLMIGCIQQNHFTFACRQSFMIYLLKSNPDNSTNKITISNMLRPFKKNYTFIFATY